MSIDRLAKDVLRGLKKNDGMLEVPVKLLFQILFKGAPANQASLHKKLLEMKTKHKDIEYVGVLNRSNPFVRFYKKSDRETKLLKGDVINDRNEDDTGQTN